LAIGGDAVVAKPMLGEYGIYLDGKMVGLICGDQLVERHTVSGSAYAEPKLDVPAYSVADGQKPDLEPKKVRHAGAAAKLLDLDVLA
jgi:TfoX/Sxy family transcriptional regulator of competence genes